MRVARCSAGMGGPGGRGGRGGQPPPMGADKWARGLAVPGSAPAGSRGTLLHKTEKRYEVSRLAKEEGGVEGGG